nr:MAG TPA: minor structural protein [Caudoviricetes sp.]
MALTRKLLKGMGLTDEQVDTIIEAHTDTVDGLKADISRYKTDAEKLPGVQKQLDDLKAAGDDGYKEKYEKEHSAFETYKADVTAKEAKAAKEKAVRAYFEGKNITGANLELAMRGCGEEMAAIELDGDKIKDTKSLDALVAGTYKGLVSTSRTKGTDTSNPPGSTGAGTMTKEKIMEIKDRAERRAQIAAHMDLFQPDMKGENE